MLETFLENNTLIIEGIYAIFALLSFIFILKLKVIFLYLGWGLFVSGLWLKFISSFSVKNNFIMIYFDEVLISLGLLIIIYGFYVLVLKKYKMERKIKLKNEDYELIFENTQDAIFLIDVNCTKFVYRRVNQAFKKITGFNASDVEGRNIFEVLGEKQAEKLKLNCQKCIESGEVINYNHNLNLFEGEKVLHTKLTPVLNNKGEIKEIVGSSRDITRLKEVEKN